VPRAGNSDAARLFTLHGVTLTGPIHQRKPGNATSRNHLRTGAAVGRPVEKGLRVRFDHVRRPQVKNFLRSGVT